MEAGRLVLAIAVAIAVGGGFAVWTLWSPAACADLAADGMDTTGVAALAVPGAVTADPPAGERAARARLAPVARVHAAAGTPGFGCMRWLRRPAFAPRVRFDAELWSAFASGPRGDLRALSEAVFDRLARLGYETVGETAWTDGAVLASPPDAIAAGGVAVALSAGAVGFARAGANAITIRTVGAAELRAAGEGGAESGAELWAWSDSAFLGPHRLGGGSVLPAARASVVQVTRAQPLCLRYFDPVCPAPGTVGMLVAAPRARERDVSLAGRLLLNPGAPAGAGDPAVWLLLAELRGAGRLVVREEGAPFGCYVEWVSGAEPKVLPVSAHLGG